MTDLRKNIEFAAHMQNRDRNVGDSNAYRSYEQTENKEIVIRMGRSTLFFIMITQLLIVTLFFVLGFAVAWNYFSQTTPSSFARPVADTRNQIVNDIADLAPSSSRGHG